ncbi:unnamed protein product [Calypogeia fissa]
MAWDRRSRSSASSSRGRGATAINALEFSSSLQPWACSSLSSSEKFLSLYEKMQEDREKRNLESLVCAPYIEQEGPVQEREEQQFSPLLPPTMMMIDKPGSKIVFPQITSRGSVVGKKVYCRTSIHSNITWRQKSSTQRMCTSLMILNFNQDRSISSNRVVLGGTQQQETQSSSSAACPTDSATSQKRRDNSLDKAQCRGLVLSLAGAAGMRLICPPVQLPLLEILLFLREQFSKNRAAAHSERGRAGLWRFPVKLALATLRPFSGSLAGRCLTALVCLAQMRTRESNNYTIERHIPIRYISVPADLYSVVSKNECNDLESKEFAKICSTDQFQIDVTETDSDDDIAAEDRAGRNTHDHNNSSIALLSNVVVGPKFKEECWSNDGVQVVEILISECEDSLSDDIVPNSLARDHKGIGSDSRFSLVELEEDSSSEPCLKRKEIEKSSSENVLVAASLNELNATVEDVRNESFAQSNFAISPPALQLPLETRSTITVVKAAADCSGKVSALEKDAMPSTDSMCLAEEEQLDATSLCEITSNLKTSIKEFSDDEPCSTPSNDVAAVVVESWLSAPRVLAVETVENQNQEGNELHDGKVVLFVEGESAERPVEQEVEVCCIEEYRIDDMSCVSSEGLQLQVAVSLLERTSAENESSDDLHGVHFKVEFGGDASESVLSEELPQQTEVSLLLTTSDGNGFEKVDVTMPVESLRLDLGETAEKQFVINRQEVRSELCVVEEESSGSVCVSPESLPDLIELLMEANWIGSRKEFSKAFFLQKPSSAKSGHEGESTHSLVEKKAVSALDQVSPIENQLLEEVQEVKSEQSIEVTLEEEHRIESDDGNDWLESLLVQVEIFISERADVLSEHERAAATAVVENEAVKDIQEIRFASPVEGKSPKSVLDQECEVRSIEEGRIDDGECVPSDRLQGYTDVFLSYRASSGNELDENESPTAGAAIVALPLTESLEKEVVKEIQEVNTNHLTEEKPVDGPLKQDLKSCPVREHEFGDRGSELLEMWQGECDSSLSERTSAENVSAAADVALSVDVPSFASTELFEGQPIKEIQEVDSLVQKYEEKVVDQGLEVCVEGQNIDDRNCKLSERFHVQVEVSLPERINGESEPVEELSDDLLETNFEVNFKEDASAPQQEESNCPTAMTGDDSQSEDIFSSNHFDATSRESCVEHPESKVISESDECSSEASTEICGAWRKSSYAQRFDSHERILLLCILFVPFFCSLTSRQNDATKAEDKATDPDSGAMAVGQDDEHNCDGRDGHEPTEAKVLDETKNCSIVADDSQQSAVLTETLVTTVESTGYENGNLDQPSRVAAEIGGNGETNRFPETCSKSTLLVEDLTTQSYPVHPFADHPTCVELRERRHTHGDQKYIDMQDLLPAPWGQLIFWHGRCKEGRPTLCVLLGKAVRHLPGQELKNFIEVTVSHLEYAELNFFKGNVKQMNILMDLEGIGFMRLPPMHILSAIGAVLNRDYAGRGGWIILVNAPLMLGFVISAIQGVILRPSNNRGAAIDSSFKGFLEGKERIMMMGGKYRSSLQKYFDTGMLPVPLGGDCCCGSDEKPCKLGNEFLKLAWDGSAHT